MYIFNNKLQSVKFVDRSPEQKGYLIYSYDRVHYLHILLKHSKIMLSRVSFNLL